MVQYGDIPRRRDGIEREKNSDFSTYVFKICEWLFVSYEKKFSCEMMYSNNQ